jgi:hypothetical protein
VDNVAPDTYDYAIFNDGAVDVTSGEIRGNSLFVGEGYTGVMEETDGEPIQFITRADAGHPEESQIIINKERGRFNIKPYANTEVDVFVENTPREIGSEIVAGQAGKTTVMVAKTGEALTLSGAVAFAEMVFSNDKNGSRNVIIDCVESPLKAANSKVTVESELGEFVLSNGAKVTVTTSGGSIEGGWIVGGSILNHKGTSIGAGIDIVNGRLTFNNNENGYIETDDITLWKKGVFDPRTDIGAWGTPNIIDVKGGGNFIVDVGRTLTITN